MWSQPSFKKALKCKVALSNFSPQSCVVFVFCSDRNENHFCLGARLFLENFIWRRLFTEEGNSEIRDKDKTTGYNTSVTISFDCILRRMSGLYWWTVLSSRREGNQGMVCKLPTHPPPPPTIPTSFQRITLAKMNRNLKRTCRACKPIVYAHETRTGRELKGAKVRSVQQYTLNVWSRGKQLI